VNVFNLIQLNGQWRIVNVSYTMEPPGSAGLAPEGIEAVRPRSLH